MSVYETNSLYIDDMMLAEGNYDCKNLGDKLPILGASKLLTN